MKKQTNIPTLRFPEFKGEWERKKFGEVYTFKVTNSFSRENLNYENGIVKNIHYGDIHTKFPVLFDITKEKVPFINLEINIDRISNENYCLESDLVFADASEDLNDVGKSIEIINVNNEKLLSGLHTLLARQINNSFVVGFGAYLFKSNTIRLQIQKVSQGSKVLSISAGRLSNILISFPTLPEQQKIASFLSLMDTKIAQLNRKKELLQAYKKGIMQKLFSQEIRFKDQNGNDFEDWEMKTLGKISKITTGKLDANAMVKNGQYRFYTCAKEYFQIDKYSFDTEALLISGNGANVGYIHYYKGKFNAYQRTYILDEFHENIFYIKYFLDMFLSQRIKAEKNEGNTPYIVLSTLTEMNIKLPCLAEQTKIANFLSVLDAKIELCSKEIAINENYKKSLLQQLFC